MGIAALLLGMVCVGFISVMAFDPDVIMVAVAFFEFLGQSIKDHALFCVFLALLFAGCIGMSASLKFRKELRQ